MRTLTLQFTADTLVQDTLTGRVERIEKGSIKTLDYDAAIAMLLEAQPIPTIVSPMKLRSGFRVLWLDGDRQREGTLMMECAFTRADRSLEEWLLVKHRGAGVFVRRDQLIGWDPTPMLAAIRETYRTAASDRVPLLAKYVLRVVIDTPDQSPNYQITLPMKGHR